MTQRHWVEIVPWRLMAAGAVAGTVLGAAAFYPAHSAFADCNILQRGPGNQTQVCTSSGGGSANTSGSNFSSGRVTIPANTSNQTQTQNQGPQFTNRSSSNGSQGEGIISRFSGAQNQSPAQNQVSNPNRNTASGVTWSEPLPNQNQWQQQSQWQQTPQQPVTAPQSTLQQPVVQPQVVTNPAPQPAFVAPQSNNSQSTVQTDTPRRRRGNDTNTTQDPVTTNTTPQWQWQQPSNNNAPAAVAPAQVVQPVNIDPPAPVLPAFVPPVLNNPPHLPSFQHQSNPGPVVNTSGFNIGPDNWSNKDIDWWKNDPDWWKHDHHDGHKHKPHDPVPPPPPVVYLPLQVFHRTVVSCASVAPYQVNYPYGYQGMPYGFNPNLVYNRYAPAPLYPVLGQTYFNNPQVYPPYVNVGFYNGYGFNGYTGYNNVWDERFVQPNGTILIVHHVVVGCAPPVVYSAPAVYNPPPVYTPPAAQVQQVSYTPPAPSASAIVQQVVSAIAQQLRGNVAPPRTGDAGFTPTEPIAPAPVSAASIAGTTTTSSLPGFVLIGFMTLMSLGVMARVRQR